MCWPNARQDVASLSSTGLTLTHGFAFKGQGLLTTSGRSAELCRERSAAHPRCSLRLSQLHGGCAGSWVRLSPGNLAPCPQQLVSCLKGGGKHLWVKGQLLKLVPLPKPGLFRSCLVRKPHLTILYFAVIPIWWDIKCRITIPAVLKL